MVSNYEIPNDKKIAYKLGPDECRSMINGFKAFDEDGSGAVDVKEFKKLLVSLGLREVTDEQVEVIMQAVDQNNDQVISWEEFIDMYGKWHADSTEDQVSKVEAVFGEKAGHMMEGTGGGHAFYKVEEVSAMSYLVNNRLDGDEDPELVKKMPINPDSEDLFPNMADGQILIKLLNLIDENAVDMRTINKYVNDMNAVAIKINIQQALTAAKGLIKLVGVNDTAFTQQNKTMILAVMTQMSRLLAVQNIDLKDCPQIYRLKYEDEELEDFAKLKPEDILIRWVNHHLAEAGQERRIKNLGKDIADSEAMTYVLHQLDKPPSTETEDRQGRTTLSPLSESDLTKRAD